MYVCFFSLFSYFQVPRKEKGFLLHLDITEGDLRPPVSLHSHWTVYFKWRAVRLYYSVWWQNWCTVAASETLKLFFKMSDNHNHMFTWKLTCYLCKWCKQPSLHYTFFWGETEIAKLFHFSMNSSEYGHLPLQPNGWSVCHVTAMSVIQFWLWTFVPSQTLSLSFHVSCLPLCNLM